MPPKKVLAKVAKVGKGKKMKEVVEEEEEVNGSLSRTAGTRGGSSDKGKGKGKKAVPKKKGKLVKGSQEAKDFMASIRAKKGKK